MLSGHTAAVRCVCYNGKYVVSGAYDHTIRVWLPDQERCVHTLEGHTNRVYSLVVRFSPLSLSGFVLIDPHPHRHILV